MGEKTYYAYLHCKPDGTPFYVGKGPRERMLTTLRPTQSYYANVAAKYGRDNLQIHGFECQSEEHAVQIEDELIEYLFDCGYKLANVGRGPTGMSGHVHTPEARKKMSQSMREAHKRPEVKARRLEIAKDLSARMKGDTRLANAVRDNPEVAERCRQGMIASRNTPESKAKRLALASTAEWKERVSEGTKRGWQVVKDKIEAADYIWAHCATVSALMPRVEAAKKVAEEGWVLGRGEFHAGRWSSPHTDKAELSKAQSEVMKRAMVGSRWVFKGDETTKTKDWQSHIDAGWTLGMGTLRKRQALALGPMVWINDGKELTRVRNPEEWIAKGWSRGFGGLRVKS